MSMDLEVWSTRDFNFPMQLPRSTLWNRYSEEFAFEGDALWAYDIKASR